LGASSGNATTDLETRDVDAGATVVLLADANLMTPDGGHCRWLPDGRIVFTLMEPQSHQSAGNLWQIRTDPATGAAVGKPLRLTKLEDATVANMTSTRDGKSLAFLKQRRQDDVYLGELESKGTRLENVRRLTMDDRQDQPSGWSRDSRSVFFSSNRQNTNDVFKQGILDKTAQAVIEGPGDQYDAILSSDGAWLIYTTWSVGFEPGVERLMRAPVSGGPPEMIAELKGFRYPLCPTVPTASCVLAQNENAKTAFYELDPLRGKGRRIGGASSEVPHWTLSPDGARIAFVDGAVVRVMQVADGVATDLHASGLGEPTDLAWSADGKALFVASRWFLSGWRMFHVDLDGRVSLLRETDGRRVLFSPVPSPDGRYLAFGERTADSNAWIMENF
jgi:Tol biopolymer transport system component